jgi:hypothetical protein
LGRLYLEGVLGVAVDVVVQFEVDRGREIFRGLVHDGECGF